MYIASVTYVIYVEPSYMYMFEERRIESFNRRNPEMSY